MVLPRPGGGGGRGEREEGREGGGGREREREREEGGGKEGDEQYNYVVVLDVQVVHHFCMHACHLETTIFNYKYALKWFQILVL